MPVVNKIISRVKQNKAIEVSTKLFMLIKKTATKQNQFMTWHNRSKPSELCNAFRKFYINNSRSKKIVTNCFSDN